MSDLKTIELGAVVEYRDGSGHRKAAIVIATPDTVEEGTGLEAPASGAAHLAVFGMRGDYRSFNIPAGEGPHTFTVL